jgi:hypothetical protein
MILWRDEMSYPNFDEWNEMQRLHHLKNFRTMLISQPKFVIMEYQQLYKNKPEYYKIVNDIIRTRFGIFGDE